MCVQGFTLVCCTADIELNLWLIWFLLLKEKKEANMK